MSMSRYDALQEILATGTALCGTHSFLSGIAASGAWRAGSFCVVSFLSLVRGTAGNDCGIAGNGLWRAGWRGIAMERE